MNIIILVVKFSSRNLLCVSVGLIQQTPIPTPLLFELKAILEVKKQWGIAKNVRIFVCVGIHQVCFCFQDCGCGNSTHSVVFRQHFETV